MHGLGNDFVVIDAVTQPIAMTAALARAIADRHYGVGCDQILLITPSPHSSADFGYRIFNADGSEVFQCGNGARCVGLFIQRKRLSDKKSIALVTERSQMMVHIQSETQIVIEIDAPDFDPASLPFSTHEKKSPYHFFLDDEKIVFDIVSVGNPHVVMMVDDLSWVDVSHLGKTISHHTAFPEGTNVSFVQWLSSNKVKLCVYERGAGITGACGSGACAAVAVGRKKRLLENTVQVYQSGGELTVTWTGKKDDSLYLTGPAEFVFDGVWHKDQQFPTNVRKTTTFQI